MFLHVVRLAVTLQTCVFLDLCLRKNVLLSQVFTQWLQGCRCVREHISLHVKYPHLSVQVVCVCVCRRVMWLIGWLSVSKQFVKHNKKGKNNWLKSMWCQINCVCVSGGGGWVNAQGIIGIDPRMFANILNKAFLEQRC